MEESLAREMARMKMEREKQSREVEKVCSESLELKELQGKIKAAYLNKERASQVTEIQFRKQIDLVSVVNLLTFFRKSIRIWTRRCLLRKNKRRQPFESSWRRKSNRCSNRSTTCRSRFK
jgi:hypothetical protein